MNPSVLIVEDSELVGHHLEKVLTDADYSITDICISGEEAIESVQQSKPEIIIMDVSLEGRYDGIETSMMINEKNDIPIIYLTAIDDPETLNRAKFSFPYTILNKPFSESELLSNLELGLFKHQADSIIKESKSLVDTILENVESCIMLYDRKGQISYMNRSLLKMLNLEANQIRKLIVDDQFIFLDLNGEELNSVELIQPRINQDPSYEVFYIFVQGKHYPIYHLYATKADFMHNGSEQIMLMFSNAQQELMRQEYEKYKEIQYLNALFDGVEQERVRVSRELHDGLGQMLKAIQLHARNIFPKQEQFEGILKMIEDATKETSRISNNMMPTRLLDFGLISALEAIGRDLEEQAIKVRFCHNLNSSLTGKEEIHVYRIVQEAYTNIAKHAAANSVFLQLYDENTYISLSIEDDGSGFDFKEVLNNESYSGNGLRNIMQRVKILNGSVDFDTSKNNGTSILIRFKRN